MKYQDKDLTPMIPPMKNKYAHFAIGYVLFGLVMQFFVPGCVTSPIRREIHSMPKYRPEQYPLTVEGSYRGTFNSSGSEYMHFYFPHFPWPARYGQEMHIFFPVMPGNSPIVINKREDLWINEYRDKNTIPVHYIYKGEKYGKSLEVPNPLKNNIPTSRAKLFITTTNNLPEIRPSEGTPFYVYLNATKDGPGSIFRVAQVLPGTKPECSPASILNDKPYQWEWYSPWYYAWYLYSVPLDIITYPAQFAISLWGYWLLKDVK